MDVVALNDEDKGFESSWGECVSLGYVFVFTPSAFHHEEFWKKANNDKTVKVWIYLSRELGELRILSNQVGIQEKDLSVMEYEPFTSSLLHVVKLLDSNLNVQILNESSTIAFYTNERSIFINFQEQQVTRLLNESIKNFQTLSKQKVLPSQALRNNNSSSIEPPKPSPRRSSIVSGFSKLVGGKSNSSSSKPPNPLDSIHEVLSNHEYRKRFTNFCKLSFAEENMNFLFAIEEFLLISTAKERKLKANEIVNEFVKEDAPQQVNISSGQRELLMNAIEHDPSNGQDIFGVFEESRKEIIDLLRRNFFERFVKKERAEASRQQQMQILIGCFSSLYGTSGLDSYLAVTTYLNSAIPDIEVLAKYLQLRLTTIQEAYQSLINKGWEYKSGIRSLQLKTTNRAIVNAYESFQDVSVLRVFSYEAGGVIKAMVDLINSTREGLDQIMKQNQAIVDSMTATRALVNQSTNAETEAGKVVVQLRQEIAQSELQKSSKTAKLKTKLAQAELDLKQSSAIRENAQIKMAEVESLNSEAMLLAMDSLQSLELHRLDTQQRLLLQAISSEQNMLSALSLKLDSVVSITLEIDPFRDILSLVESMSNASKASRRLSMIPVATVVPS